jgi:exodeoxyribonuclease V alpha subunit
MSAGSGLSQDVRELGGTIEQVRHHNEDDGWTVARLRVGEAYGGAGDVVAVVGNIADAREGVDIRLWGEWATHPRYGEQFRFVRYQIELPMTSEAIERFLAAGGVKGIGPARAKAIAERFGDDVLHVLDEEPARLAEIKGISKKKALAVGEEWREQREGDKQGMLVRLQGMGISSAQAIRIYRHYADRSVAVVEENPYQLAMEVDGIGFRIADRIASCRRGSPMRSRRRPTRATATCPRGGC